MTSLLPRVFLFVLVLSTLSRPVTPCTCSLSSATLKCSDCSSIPTFSDPSNIQHLDLSSPTNTLTHLTSNVFINAGFYNLKSINLSSSGLVEVDEAAFLGITEFQNVHVDLSQNKISSVKLDRYTHSPEYVNLSGNPIKQLSFAPVAINAMVDLSNCSMTKLPPGYPFRNKFAFVVNLASNKLETLSWTNFEGAIFLSNLTLRDNPWRCDCHMHFLNDYLRYVRKVDVSGDVVCQTPDNLRGRVLSTIPPGDLGCPVRDIKVSSKVTGKKILLTCVAESYPGPEFEWRQGPNHTGDLLTSGNGISIYTVSPPPSQTGQLYRYNWESRVEIWANSSAYMDPSTFWCTVKNRHGWAYQGITISDYTTPSTRPESVSESRNEITIDPEVQTSTSQILQKYGTKTNYEASLVTNLSVIIGIQAVVILIMVAMFSLVVVRLTYKPCCHTLVPGDANPHVEPTPPPSYIGEKSETWQDGDNKSE